MRDLLQATTDGVDLCRRLGIDTTKQRLPEVRQLRTAEASDEALRPDHSDLPLAELGGRRGVVEHVYARVRERCGDLLAETQVQIMVPEHRAHRDVEPATRVRDDLGLLGVAVRRQVAGQQHDVDPLLERRERLLDVSARRRRGVQIARCRDRHHDGHVPRRRRKGNRRT